MKVKVTHTQKALIITLIIELVIIALLFNLGFKEQPKEQTYAVEFIDDNFNFEDLKPEEKLELPDIQKYVHQKYQTNMASNALQEEKSFEEFRKQQEEALKEFHEKRAQQAELNTGEPDENKQKPEDKKEVRFTGNSNIRYFIQNRQDIYIDNPLYTCPKNMTGLIVIDIEVDRTGKVVKAVYNKEKSTSQADCLINSAIEAAYNSFFNSDDTAPTIQKGYITYYF